MPPKGTRNSRKKRNHWNKQKKATQQNRKKRHKKGIDADMMELSQIFNSAKSKSNKTRNKSKQSNLNNSSTKKIITAKKANLMIIKNSLNDLANAKNSVIPFISRKKQQKMEKKDKSQKQLHSLPNNILIPKCSLCRSKLTIKRGDQCYSEYASVSCDCCGREDIHGEVWHCRQCEGGNGFNLCRTCGYLISHKRQNEIRRVAPPQDDMGLVSNKSVRNRTVDLDGFAIYKHDEIKKTLRIGLGGNTTNCPFDCQCCF